jgi:hypothetical protein
MPKKPPTPKRYFRWLGYTSGASLITAAIIICGARGCAQPPGTVLVVGRVTYNGQPVAKARVTFASEYRDAPAAYADTDADGRYALRTVIGLRELIDGAFPGEYRVTVAKSIPGFRGKPDSELWWRHCMRTGRWGPGDREFYEEGAMKDDFEDATGDFEPEPVEFSVGFRPPPDTDIPSILEMAALTRKQLRSLTDEQLKALRPPPNFVGLGHSRELDDAMQLYYGGKRLVPARYFDHTTSGLTATIERTDYEPLVFDFDLTDEEPADSSQLASAAAASAASSHLLGVHRP